MVSFQIAVCDKVLLRKTLERAFRRGRRRGGRTYFVPKMRSPAISRRCAARNPYGDQNRRPMTRPAARFCCAKRLNAPSGADGAAGWGRLLRTENAVARDFAPMRGAKPLRGSKPQADDSPCGKVLLRKTLERAFRRGRRRGVGEFTSCRRCGRPRRRDPGRCSRAR